MQYEVVIMFLDSILTRSMGSGGLVERPQLEWAPLMHWMAEQRRDWQRSQDMVETYDWSDFVAGDEASLL